ncbi:MAG: hypothetical protein Q9227_001491 [Pyrenula ochraceoflavens]
MADPFSIIGFVSAAVKLSFDTGTTLYRFIQATQDVDQTVRDLYSEIIGVAKSLKSLEGALDTTAVRAIPSQIGDKKTQDLWISVKSSVADCTRTVHHLHRKLVDCRPEGGNLLQQWIRQFKLNLKSDDIATLRAQLQTHKTTLHTSLLMIDVAITIAGARSSNSNASDGSTGSVLGDPLEPAEVSRIATWVSNTPTLVRESQVSSDMSLRPSRNSPSSFAVYPHRDSQTFLDGEEEDENDDDDLVSTFVERYLREAAEHRGNMEFAEAEDCYLRALKKAELLGERKRQKLRLDSLRLDLGLTAFEMNHYDKAEGYLKELADDCSNRRSSATKAMRSEDEKLRQGLTACQVLAKIYLLRNELISAEVYCMKSLQGMYRLRAVDPTGFYPSARLMTAIANSKGDEKEAKMYLDMIPTIPPPQTEFPLVPGPTATTPSASIASNHGPSLPSVAPLSLSEPAEAQLRSPTRCSGTSRQGSRSSTGGSAPTIVLDEDPVMIETLKDNGFDVHSKSYDSENALLWAARNGEEHIMRQLITGICVRSVTGTNSTIKAKTVKARNIDKPDEEGHTPLIAASIRGHHRAVEILTFVGAKLGPKTRVEGRNALHFASFRGHGRVVQSLVHAGADLDAPDASGQTCLHLAGGKDPARIVEVLAQAGANLEARSLSGCTPLHSAILERRQAAAECLLQHGAKINAAIAPPKGATSAISVSATSTDILGISRIPPLQQPTPLHLAATSGDTDILSLLLRPEWNAEIESRTTDGRTPLHAAVIAGQIPALKMLLTSGADVESKDVHGRTALHLIVGSGANNFNSSQDDSITSGPSSKPAHIIILNHLLENNASTSSRESDGCTPLHIAAFEGDVQAVTVLLDYGADPELTRVGGLTAADLAKKVGQVEVHRILEERCGKKSNGVRKVKRFGLGMGRKLTA